MIRRGEVTASPLPPGSTRRVRREPSIDPESVEHLRQRREVERALEVEREAERLRHLAERQPPDDGQVWLSIATTAALVGVERTTIRYKVAAGRIPAIRRGRRWWIRRQDAEVVANARRFRQRAAHKPMAEQQNPGAWRAQT
ncbi:MAG: excisionase family DNA-binding protein [Ornithinimicrobium sp.]